MCELLGMSANVPTDICFSFSGLLERGGNTGPHKDGWGITFYEGKGCRTFKDPEPSCQSEIAKLVKAYPIKSVSVISHIRQGNRGRTCLENTHPFTRELWGREITYAHNGQLSDYKDLKTDFYRPVGNTDSELAFCWILDKVREKYPNRPSNMVSVFRYIAKLGHTLREKGVFNMLITDGIYVLAYCTNNLHWITRRAPFGKATLIDADMVVDFQKETTPDDVVTVIATRPLTNDEQWQKLQPGEFALFKLGEKV
ncbi:MULTISPECIES: class II glutamine amidotransferase [Pseudoalteromonas]|uniref:Glutamine amidotransferase n=1 Tax=Pseudoalteromonas peptidolytica F12-50-A1 TaxID=1315280 RepID=A0A8I0MVI2_9GAMM|nr:MULTISPECIES: class II glutamine amidotransferase [Pseudoalteromonas]MBE0346015.1 glutamine amidotransferase [Pseudoalteromonas peptidolytica F12-50-A1]NLR14739.1 class II glutamine amidotransferase [Pseudoalteromonas peptidolytica]RRS08510.1 class II glutamine amidotransferase [Pseudoalteromonas sp. J010]RXF02557.1 class II glutamine amidotransferase [Pseudoalteromonas sp. PS5]GEK10392.1 class II glutamine amidotransferase [Pseudoalteromonas peptidolytica]